MSPGEIAAHLRLRTYNRWSGILILDAKYLNRRQTLLLAIDFVTLDIVAWLVVPAETLESYTRLIDMVESCGYIIRALVSDGHPGIIALTHTPKPHFRRKGTRQYPRPGVPVGNAERPPRLSVPHQLCCVHAGRDIDRYLRRLPKEERMSLHIRVYAVLFAKTLSKANRLKRKLEEETALAPIPARRVTAWVHAHWEMLTVHHAARVGRRKIPRDTNAMENAISYVNTRLKTMRRLRTTASAVPITNLIVVNYRTKPLTNSGNKLKRGKSPLALAMGKKGKLDWMTFIKKPTR